MITSALIPKKTSRSTVGGYNDVESSIIVDVGISCAACHTRTGKVRSHLGCRFNKLALTKIAKEVRRLRVMDSTALALCMENGMPLNVFNMDDDSALAQIISGERVGTLVSTSAGDEDGH